MTTGTTSLLSLALPVEGELDGTWGDVVNYGITDYVDIAVAGTLTLTGDGAVTLSNTAGNASGTNIVSSLTGAGTVTAQFAVVKITGTLTTTKIVTAPSTSKTYIVDNTATGGSVTFKASGQTGISVAVGEKCTVYFNGTDYVKVASSVADGVTSVSGTGTVNGITLTGTVTSTGSLTLGGTLSGVNLASQVTGTLPIANGGTGTTSTTFVNLGTNVTGTLPVANGGTGVTTSTGTGNVVLSNSPTLVTPALGTPSSGVATNLTGLPLTTGVTGTLPVANGGTGTTTPSLVAGTGIAVTGTWPNQTIASSGGAVSSVTASSPLASSGGTTPNISFTGILPVANGGTATATPTLVAGSNVTITGTWPNQTIAAVGGGGVTAGIYPAIAYGALANGDKVVINSDGTVSSVASATSSAGTAADFSGGSNVYNGNSLSITYDSTNNVVVAVYATSSTSYGYATVGTISGTTITWGTPVQFEGSSGVSYPSATFDASTGKVVIAYSISGAGKAIVGTVSGTTISFGTAVTFQAASTSQTSAVYDSTNAKVVISYTVTSTNYGYSIVGTVSGTTISFGTAVAFNSASTFYVSSVYTGSKVVVSYRNGGGSFYGTSIVGTVSGTSISFGTSAVFSSSVSNYIVSAYDSLNGKVVVSFSDNGNSDYGTAVVGTVSGTSISFGTKVVYNSQYTTNTSIAYSPYAKRIVIGCWNPATSFYGGSIAGTVSGTSISFSSFYTYNAVDTYQPMMVYNTSIQKVVVAYQKSSATGVGSAQVLTVGFATNLTATNFIGISDAAYATGATATIQTVGSTDDAQSGLTAGLAYYVQTDGTLSSTAGSPSVFAGTAVSATKIIIKG